MFRLALPVIPKDRQPRGMFRIIPINFRTVMAPDSGKYETFQPGDHANFKFPQFGTKQEMIPVEISAHGRMRGASPVQPHCSSVKCGKHFRIGTRDIKGFRWRTALSGRPVIIRNRSPGESRIHVPAAFPPVFPVRAADDSWLSPAEHR